MKSTISDKSTYKKKCPNCGKKQWDKIYLLTIEGKQEVIGQSKCRNCSYVINA